ncbi:N-dimethylarginine dimethylaminohydrolase [Propionicimonas paludicola]|uniref:N-dimethylarginine dimethylaminohydrolase n=1 Tax=Propionicimonas paludicola TaxID=185243 RepID=A0A2A9CPL2_9ACTN|nr:dimethylargininase [Propionicimonas paludicola]PFG15600.1 N-dimethylarginine dimethylaminohydrolase [Propionicimonas paludicola]
MTVIEERCPENLTDAAAAPTASGRTAPRVLMCRPEHFTVSYRINPWMYPQQPTDTSLALRQWQELYRTYQGLGFQVELIDPEPGLPDMVYAANGGFTLDGVAYTAKFRHAERGPEGPAYGAWFGAHGFQVAEAVSVNEGEGDFMLVGDTIFAGTGFRSDDASHDELRSIFDREVVTLRLVDPRFYHLDTAFAVLDPAGGPASVAYLPSAFDEASLAILRTRFPDAILATQADAEVLGLNSFSDGCNVVIASRAETFARDLTDRGFRPHGVDLSELLRGGGGVKCCTLVLR